MTVRARREIKETNHNSKEQRSRGKITNIRVTNHLLRPKERERTEVKGKEEVSQKVRKAQKEEERRGRKSYLLFLLPSLRK